VATRAALADAIGFSVGASKVEKLHRPRVALCKGVVAAPEPQRLFDVKALGP
jgi:hypothetical protein